MFASFKTLPQLFDYFKDNETCLAYWEQIRWNGNVTCPHCGAEKPYKTNRGYKCKNKECQKKFSALVGSIFENTNLPLRTWFGAIFLCCNHKKGISSLQLSRDLGIHQKSAWFLLHRIRETFKEVAPEALGGDGVIVEVDNTIVGGKAKNMSNKKRKTMKNNREAAMANKSTVTAYVERGGTIRFDVKDNGESEPELLRKHVDTDSILMTDTANVYNKVGMEYAHHETVDHNNHEYVREKVWHTNTVEGAFSLFDRMVIGTYHNISKKHLQAYCNETAFRYNTRKSNNPERFDNAMKHFAGARLKYEALTGK